MVLNEVELKRKAELVAKEADKAQGMSEAEKVELKALRDKEAKA